MGAKDGKNDDEADDTNGGEEGGGCPAVNDGNDDDYDEEVMGVLPHLVARRIERLKRLNT